MVTRRRSGTTRRATTSARSPRRSTSRRTGYGYRYPTRRRRRGTAASFGSAFGLLLVYVLVNGSWAMRLGMLVLAAVLVVGYLVLAGRAGHVDHPAGDPPDAGAAPAGPASATDPDPAPEDRP